MTDQSRAPVPETSGPRAPVLLIDGRSGSGKTELASAIARDNPEAELLRLDNVYPGWGGLELGSAHVHRFVLTEHRWQRWDWLTNGLNEWHDLDPSRPLIIEGCGALSAANRSLATYGVWVEFDDVGRKRRALERDGDWFVPHWDEWAAQEEAFIVRERPQRVADLIVQGDAPLQELADLVSRRLSAAASGRLSGEPIQRRTR
jgi:uridine kinase